jgi:hypothetical protein
MNVSGVGSASSAGGVDPGQQGLQLGDLDRLLANLRTIDPNVATKLSDQIQTLQAKGASRAEIGEAVKQALSQLSDSQRASLFKAFQGASHGRRTHHHRHHHTDAASAPGTTGAGVPGSVGNADGTTTSGSSSGSIDVLA